MASTRDFYKVLGVEPGASREDIRRAHRELVRALHPDRHGVSTTAERALAERRMREINEAWHVLGEPGRRSAYDQELSRSNGATRPSGRPPRPPVSEPELEDDTDGLEVHPGTFMLLRRGPMIVMLLVGLLIFVFTAYAGGRDEGPREVTNAGCVLLLEGSRGVLVDCSLPNDGEVVEEVDAPLDCSEGNRYAQVGSEFYCIPIE